MDRSLALITFNVLCLIGGCLFTRKFGYDLLKLSLNVKIIALLTSLIIGYWSLPGEIYFLASVLSVLNAFLFGFFWEGTDDKKVMSAFEE